MDNHILPALGKMPLEGVERSHVVELHRTLSDRPASVNRAVKILSHMYRLCCSPRGRGAENRIALVRGP